MDEWMKKKPQKKTESLMIIKQSHHSCISFLILSPSATKWPATLLIPPPPPPITANHCQSFFTGNGPRTLTSHHSFNTCLLKICKISKILHYWTVNAKSRIQQALTGFSLLLLISCWYQRDCFISPHVPSYALWVVLDVAIDVPDHWSEILQTVTRICISRSAALSLSPVR